jgi:hypothetical protein
MDNELNWVLQRVDAHGGHASVGGQQLQCVKEGELRNEMYMYSQLDSNFEK